MSRPPRRPPSGLLGLYLLSPSGLAAVRVERPGFSEDPRSLAMMLGVVAGFLSEALCKDKQRDALRVLRAAVDDRGFCAVPSANFTLLAVHEGREARGFIGSLQALAGDLERRVGGSLRDWDGNRASLKPAEALIGGFVGRGTHALSR